MKLFKTKALISIIESEDKYSEFIIKFRILINSKRFKSLVARICYNTFSVGDKEVEHRIG